MGESKRKRVPALTQVDGSGDEPQVVDKLGGRMYVRWGQSAAATPHGQLVFFAESLTQRQDAHHPVPLQLDAHLGHRRSVAHQLHVPAARRQHQEGAARRVPQALRAHLKQRLLIIWDGLKAHRSKLVREYLDSTGGDIQMAFLPPYSPDLNPVELLWAWLKRHALANFCPANLNELNTTARTRLKSAQRRPSIIAACCVQAGLW